MPPTRVDPNVLSWATDIDQQAIVQAGRTGRLPFVEGHVALMADAHVGKGSTIGSVIPTRGAIIPAAIGVDIGCGMIAAELPFTSDRLGDDLQLLHSAIAQAVPAGVGKGHSEARHGLDKRLPGLHKAATAFSHKQAQKLIVQFGTLGSGNHFVEVCEDERGVVWAVLHSGSRGIGNELAKVHIEGAKGLMRERFIKLEDPDLAYFVEGEPAFKAYIADMLWAQDYAAGNREVMLDAVLAELAKFTGLDSWGWTRRINCHHNYTEMEHHHGKNVWLTRKGAIRAREGDMGVIPGSMGTSTYIVRGLGNPSSYHSSSHGAGRRLSRGRARRELDVEVLEAQMAGKAWNGNAQALLDEAPDAYKDIDEVMANQADLVSVEHQLTQLLNYKGL